jgi:hypothetical protein
MAFTAVCGGVIGPRQVSFTEIGARSQFSLPERNPRRGTS